MAVPASRAKRWRPRQRASAAPMQKVFYPIANRGLIASRLNEGLPVNRGRAACAICDTPTLLFLDPASLFQALQVCKLWWGQAMAAETLRFFLAVRPGGRPPLCCLQSKHRRAVWPFILAGHDCPPGELDLDPDLEPGGGFAAGGTAAGGTDDDDDDDDDVFSNCRQLIRKDVPRTFRKDSAHWGSQNGQQALYRSLLFYARVRGGYCQGMNYLAATLLEVLGNASLATKCLLGLPLENLFEPPLAGAAQMCALLDDMLEAYLPALHGKLTSHRLSANLWALRWIMTLGSIDFPLDSLELIWDQILLGQRLMLHQVLLLVLEQHQDELLAKNSMEELYGLLRSLGPQCRLDRATLLHATQRFPEKLPAIRVMRSPF